MLVRGKEGLTVRELAPHQSDHELTSRPSRTSSWFSPTSQNRDVGTRFGWLGPATSQHRNEGHPTLSLPAVVAVLGDVFGVVDGGDLLFGDAVDGGEQVVDYVFKLALAFDDGAHALQVFIVERAFHQGDGVALGDVIETEAFGGFGLDADLVEVDVEEFGDPGAHVSGDGGNFGRGEDQGAIDVDDLVAGVLELFESELDEDAGVGVFPARIAGRKKGADVAGGDGAEKSVSDGVEEHVAVGVAGEALGMFDGHAADAQGDARLERMRVPAESDPCIHSSFCLYQISLTQIAGSGGGALSQIELSELEVSGLSDLEIEGRPGDNGHGVPGAFDHGGFIGPDESIGHGFGECALEQIVAESLGRLGENDELAGNGGSDEGAVGSALDLFNGDDGGKADNGGAVLDDCVDGAFDGGGVDEGPHGVVDEDDVIGVSGKG